MDFGSLFGFNLIGWLRRMHCLLGTDHHPTKKINTKLLAIVSEYFGFLFFLELFLFFFF